MATVLSGFGFCRGRCVSRPPYGSTRDFGASATTWARRRSDKYRGAAAVEFAVVAPVLFLLIFGMIDVGRALMVQNLLTNAARDGARTASLGGITAADVEAQVTSLLAGSHVPGASVTVTPNPLTSAAVGDPVNVNVQVPYASVSWLGSSFFFKGVTLESTIVMRRETGQ